MSDASIIEFGPRRSASVLTSTHCFHHYRAGIAVVSIAWIFPVLTGAILAARFYVRSIVLHRLSVDDFIIFIGFALAIADSAFVTISAYWGLGQHIVDLQSQSQQIAFAVKYVFLCLFFSILSPGFGRISYAFLLLSLVPPTLNRRRFLWGIITLQFIIDVVTIITGISECHPPEKFWDPSVEGECWPRSVQQTIGTVQGAICSAVDLILALFPASLFWKMNMKLKQKISLSIFMGLGIFSMIASIVKTIELQVLTATADPTYDLASLAIWWTIEAYLVLIAVSIPTLGPIIITRSDALTNGSPAETFMNTFNLKKKANPDTPKNDRPYERLYDSVVRTNITSNHEISSYKASQRKDLVTSPHGIQKDTTVSVAYD
ncbi:integral membrane protein [Nemania serpens]|nr:integral membrane protein [Nemania serpens]